MKLERISENKIRCTLNKADLADKQLLLSELAYGTDKAKELFSEMMSKAYDELGFDAENIPLMVEAIPVSKECLVLIITKVEDPEELDTRFSHFSKPPMDISMLDDEEDESEEDEETANMLEPYIQHTADLLDSLLHSFEKPTSGESEEDDLPFAGKLPKSIKDKNNQNIPQFKVYRFKNLEEVNTVAELLETLYDGENSLFKNPANNMYYLTLYKDDDTEGFHRVCNIISEYGEYQNVTKATPYYYQEHYKPIIQKNALQTLSKL